MSAPDNTTQAQAVLRVCGIVDGTSVDGPGLRTSIYFAGCRHRCPGCHNPSTWDFQAGTAMSLDSILQRIDDNGLAVTFSGGDPIYSAGALLPLARAIKERGLGLWLYTGFRFEELEALGPDVARLLECVDVLVDGPYIEALRDTDLRFRGSSNQRLIDLGAMRRSNTRDIIIYQPWS